MPYTIPGNAKQKQLLTQPWTYKAYRLIARNDATISCGVVPGGACHGKSKPPCCNGGRGLLLPELPGGRTELSAILPIDSTEQAAMGLHICKAYPIAVGIQLEVKCGSQRLPRCNRTALSGILLTRLYHFACKDLTKLCLYCAHQCCSLLKGQCVQRLMQKNDLVQRRFVYDSIKRKTTGIIACERY